MSLPGFLWARRHPLRMMAELGAWPGDLAEVRIGSQSFVLIKHPDLVQELLVGHADQVEKGRTAERKRFFAFLGDGLLTSEGEAHRRQRRLMLPAFHRSRLASYGEIMVRTATAASSKWREGETRDFTAEMMNLTLSVVGNALFSSDLGGAAETIANAFNGLVTNLNQLIFPGASWILRSPLPFARRIRRAQATLDEIIYRLIRARRADKGDTGDLLSTLLLAEDAENPGEGLSDVEIRNQVMTLFFAGQETTANALSWIWWLLAQDPEAQAALKAELARVLGAREPSFSDVPHLIFTGQIVSEALRLYPPVWTMGRSALADIALGGHAIRKGSLVLASQWVIQRDSRWFPDPAAFRPSRWTSEFRGQLPRFAFFPFGGGARSCIGEHFAWTELVLVVATIARQWRPSLTPEARDIQPFPRISLCSDRPVRLRLDRP
jgi:cytochrome P450